MIRTRRAPIAPRLAYLLGLACLLSSPSRAAGESSPGSSIFAEALAAASTASAPGERAEQLSAMARLEGAAALWAERVGTGGLDQAEWEVLDELAERMEPGVIHRDLLKALSEDRPVAWRSAAIDLLARAGGARDLALLLKLATVADSGKEAGGDAALPRIAERALSRALDAILARDERAIDELRRLDPASVELHQALIRAAGRSGDPRAADWIVGFLPDIEVGGTALVELRRLAPAIPMDHARSIAKSLRPLLNDADSGRRKHAMAALANLGDDSSMPRMIRALEEGPTSEQAAAQAALEDLTGRDLGHHAQAWRVWYEAERRWWAEESDAVLYALTDVDQSACVSALAQVGMRGLRRDELARAAASALRHEAPGVRAAACRALGRLRSSVALPALRSALEDDDADVREHAQSAVAAITR